MEKNSAISIDSVEYRLVEQFPSVEEYIKLRQAAGMSPRSKEAARMGLPWTWYGVSIWHGENCIGMGRVIGDGGCFFQIVDIAVEPRYQGKRLGSRIMDALVKRLRTYAPTTALVSLLADGQAYRLYEKFGFTISAPDSIGMVLRL